MISFTAVKINQHLCPDIILEAEIQTALCVPIEALREQWWYRHVVKGVYGNTREDRQTPTGRERTHPTQKTRGGRSMVPDRALQSVACSEKAVLPRARTSHSMSIYRVTKPWQAQFHSENIREEKAQRL